MTLPIGGNSPLTLKQVGSVIRAVGDAANDPTVAEQLTVPTKAEIHRLMKLGDRLVHLGQRVNFKA